MSFVQVFWKHGKKEKLLITTNFSFSHSVFYPYGKISAIFIKFEIDMCKTLSVWKSLEFVVWERVKKGLKNKGLCGNGLTHYQTTNFRLFLIERVCRRQFQMWRKWKKVIQTSRKHCGKRRNCSLRAISPFPAVFSKGLFPRCVKRCHCVEWVRNVA